MNTTGEFSYFRVYPPLPLLSLQALCSLHAEHLLYFDEKMRSVDSVAEMIYVMWDELERQAVEEIFSVIVHADVSETNLQDDEVFTDSLVLPMYRNPKKSFRAAYAAYNKLLKCCIHFGMRSQLSKDDLRVASIEQLKRCVPQILPNGTLTTEWTKLEYEQYFACHPLDEIRLPIFTGIKHLADNFPDPCLVPPLARLFPKTCGNALRARGRGAKYKPSMPQPDEDDDPEIWRA